MNAPIVLVTGFEPFDAEAVNPAGLIAASLDGEIIEGHRVVGAILPVSFAQAPERLAALLDEYRPQLVIALGQAGGRIGITFERVAINLIDARIADNDGLQPVDAAVLNSGPAACFTSLPVKAMCAELDTLGVTSSLSLSAGSFVCNQVFYWLAHLIAREHPQARGGFIHVPWLPEQAARHGDAADMPLETQLLAIRAAIACALRTPEDIHFAAGSTH